MILLDVNQIMLAAFFASVGKHTNVKIEESLIRHMFLNTIRTLNLKFRHEYGNMVIVSDSHSYWRKDIFPHYKASRKTNRQQVDVDWKSLFACMDMVKEELRNFFPYKYIEVEKAEADDIIGTVCMNYRNEKILIISGDKDFKQLQTNENILQYDPIHNRFLKENDPEAYLYDHILRGDPGDGIPNVASQDDSFVVGKRQTSMTKKLMEKLSVIEEDSPYYVNYVRNKTLIDLREIPQTLQEAIITEFEKDDQCNDRSRLMKYFVDKQMKNLFEHMSDF